MSKPPVVGKSAEEVWPVTNAFPPPSTAMPRPESLPAPPRYDDHAMLAPATFTLVTNVSEPASVVSKPPVVGKSVE